MLLSILHHKAFYAKIVMRECNARKNIFSFRKI